MALEDMINNLEKLTNNFSEMHKKLLNDVDNLQQSTNDISKDLTEEQKDKLDKIDFNNFIQNAIIKAKKGDTSVAGDIKKFTDKVKKEFQKDKE